MSTKPRSDSVLKTLPADRQASIAEYAADHSLSETTAWLKADGVKTSKSSLSEFLSWYALRQQLAKNESTVETLLADLTKENPDWNPEKIQTVGQSFFTALALQQQDPSIWVATQRLNLDRDSARTRFALEQQKLAQAERKIVLLEKKATAFDQAKGVMGDQALTEEQRAARMRELFGM